MTKLSNSLRAALATAVATFVSTFGMSAVGWLSDVQDAVAGGGPVPSLSILGSAAVAALLAAVAGFGNWAVRTSQEVLGRGTPPVYPSNYRKVIPWK